MRLKTDIFCRVIDNYGDIGVSYRLARQLRDDHAWRVRLWVDHLASFARLEPRINPRLQTQWVDDIEVVRWDDQVSELSPSDIVIASFSCDLPDSYLRQLHDHRTQWINLDYLSAEHWVEGCHALPSIRSDGLSSHFFFPGFTDKTGGLLRESDLMAKRVLWQADRKAQAAFLQSLGVAEDEVERWRQPSDQTPLLVSLFCYPQASVSRLLDSFATQTRAVSILIPDGVAPSVPSGKYGRCRIQRIPFLPQQEYDKVLWTADMNFVRGEDSLVRAIWAGRPFVWQIYPQDEETHFIKLSAWLSLAIKRTDVSNLFLAWNAHPEASNLEQALSQALQSSVFDAWRRDALEFSIGQSQNTDLVSRLVKFCESSASQAQNG